MYPRLILFALTFNALSSVKAEQPAKPKPGAMEVRLLDNRRREWVVRNEKLTLLTDYGKLLIPIRDIHKIEFATRMTDEDRKHIASAIGKFADTEFQVRETAGEDLLKLGQKSYAALLEASKSQDPEVRHRAASLIDKLRERFPDEELTVRKHDVVWTENSKFAGHLETTVLLIDSTRGESKISVAELHSMRWLGADDVDPANVIADPGTLVGLQNHLNKTFAFRVTGGVAGSLWGTDTYTTDSSLALAAVHSGILKPGQTGIVRVTIVTPPASFNGSTRNGVTSMAWGPYPSAFKLKK